MKTADYLKQIDNSNSFAELFNIVRNLPNSPDHDKIVLAAITRQIEIKGNSNN